ncbi:MAG: hypothetical protein KDD94_03155 [Calditrichaeota bacterium]|nr:hypothetical protein [Calditrichota bacterium]
MWSILFYVFSLIIGDIPTRVLLTVFGLSLNHYYFMRAGRSAHPSETNPKKMILLSLYSIMCLLVVTEILLVDEEVFVQMSLTYSIILILAAVNLRIGINLAYARMYGNVSKLILIGIFFILGLLTEEFAFQLMFYIASAVFAWYLYISNRYEDALMKIDMKKFKFRTEK